MNTQTSEFCTAAEFKLSRACCLCIAGLTSQQPAITREHRSPVPRNRHVAMTKDFSASSSVQYVYPDTNMPSLAESAAAFSSSAVYLPSWASEFRRARVMRASCAASILSGLPIHVLSTEFCSARAYEKDTFHGLASWFMALRCSVAATSLCPPM